MAEKDKESGDIYYVLEEDPETVRIEEPFNWLLYQLGILKKTEKVEEIQKPKKLLGIFGGNR